MAQLIMIVQILVPESDAENALRNQRANIVLDEIWTALIVKASSKALNQPDHPGRLIPATTLLASLLTAPPSNAATTWRDSTRANAWLFALHCVCIGEHLRV